MKEREKASPEMRGEAFGFVVVVSVLAKSAGVYSTGAVSS